MSDKRPVKDSDWVSGLFGIMPRSRDATHRNNRRYTNLHFNFADTSLGGSQAINTPPQFTINADPPFSGLFARPVGRSRSKAVPDDGLNNTLNRIESRRKPVGSYRQGAFFFESIYQNAHYAHFRFGKQKYTGIVSFFANNYDSNLAHLARTGDYNSFIRTAGAWTGAAALFGVLGPAVFFPVVITAQVLKFVTGMSPSKYYYLKPTMHSYLRALQSMADTQGLHHRLFPMVEVWGRNYEDSVKRQDLDMDEVYSALPDIWKSSGRSGGQGAAGFLQTKFDVYKMLNRYQTLSNYQARKLNEIYEAASDEEEYMSLLEAHMKMAREDFIMQNYLAETDPSLIKLEEAYSKNPAYHSDSTEPEAERVMKALRGQMEDTEFGDNNVTQDQQATQMAVSEDLAKSSEIESFFDSVRRWTASSVTDISDQASSELLDGGQWMSWMVSNKESITDSFSNTTKEPEISSSLKGIASSARSIKVSTADGNTGFGFVDKAIDGVRQFAAGLVDSVHLTGLAALYNASIIDFQEVWEDSSADVGNITLEFPLQSWSGNDLDIYQNVVMPYLCWLTAVLPNSTGKQSYDNPFYVEAYSPGKFVIREGMITGVTLRRGEGNMPYRADGKALGGTISVTIKDMSRIIHMPLIQKPGVYDDDNKFSDYMAVLGSASLFELTNGIQKINFNLNKWAMSWKSYLSTGNATSTVMNGFTARTLSQFLSEGRARN